MKKIVRLTESDLVRLVRRVINEGPESFDIVPLTLQNAGSNPMIMDGNGRNIFQNIVMLQSGTGFNLKGKLGLNMEEGELITASITLDPTWLVTGEILKKDNWGTQISFDAKTKQVTFKFKVPNNEVFNSTQNDFYPFVVLRCNNIEKGEMTIGVDLPRATVLPPSNQQKTNESYRRRYYR